MEYGKRNPDIKHRYGVLFWEDEWHVIRVRHYDITGQMQTELVASGFENYDMAAKAAERFTADAIRSATNEAAGVCACGRPYEDH